MKEVSASDVVFQEPGGGNDLVSKILRALSVAEGTRGRYDIPGASGEQGKYQFMPDTWRKWSYMYAGEELDQTPENEEEVARFKVKTLLDNGLSPLEVASYHNSGRRRWEGHTGVNGQGVRYDTPAYVRKFADAFDSDVAPKPKFKPVPQDRIAFVKETEQEGHGDTPAKSFIRSQVESGKSADEALAMLKDEAVLDTDTSPVELLAAGIGGPGYLLGKQAARMGASKLAALGYGAARGAISGAVGVPSSLVTEPVSEYVEEKTGIPSFATNLGLSLLSGATIEQATENAIVKGAGVAEKGVKSIADMDIGRAIKELAVDEVGGVRLAGKLKEVPADMVALSHTEMPEFQNKLSGAVDELVDKNQQLYSAAGGVAGFEEDEEGNLRYDPVKGALGVVLGTSGAKVASKMRGKGAGKTAGKAAQNIIDLGTPIVDAEEYKNTVLRGAEALLDNPQKAQVLGKYIDSINIDRISSEEDAKLLMKNVSEKLQPHIQQQRRGRISHEETQAMAQRSGLSEDDLIKMDPGTALSAEDGLASRMLNAASATKLMQAREMLLKAEQNGTLTDEMALGFQRMLVRHQLIQSAESGVATEAGRALSARRIIVSPDQMRDKSIKAMLDALGGKEVTVEIAKRMAAIDPTDLTKVNQFIHDVSKATTFDKVYEVWINSMLSAPTTHIANTVSNTLAFAAKIPEKTIAATLEAGKVFLNPSKQRERYFGEVTEQLFSSIQGMKNGLKAAQYALVNEMPMDAISKLEMGETKAIKGKTGHLVRLPGRLLMAADEFFKAVNYTTEMNGIAYRMARQQGLSGDDLNNEIARLLANPTNEMTEAAGKEMRYRVFQQEYGDFTKHLAMARSKDPTKISRFVLPFLRTPINIAKYGLERTPFGLFHTAAKAYQKQLKPGQAADEVSRAAFGSAMGLMVAMAAADGTFTGGGPKNSDQRAALMRTGWQPYSFKFGDTYYSYQRYEPIASIVGMAADLVETGKDLSESDKLSVVERVSKSIANNFTSKTFVKGMTDMLLAWSDPEQYGARWAESLTGTVVPSGVAALARARDPYLRDTKRENFADELSATLKSRIPGISETLPERRNIWGQPVERAGSPISRFLSPSPGQKIREDAVNAELSRLRNVATIGDPTRTIQRQGRRLKLTPEQNAELLDLVGEKAKPFIERMIQHPNYARIDDTRKMYEIKKVYDMVKNQARDFMFQKYRDQAVQVR